MAHYHATPPSTQPAPASPTLKLHNGQDIEIPKLAVPLKREKGRHWNDDSDTEYPLEGFDADELVDALEMSEKSRALVGDNVRYIPSMTMYAIRNHVPSPAMPTGSSEVDPDELDALRDAEMAELKGMALRSPSSHSTRHPIKQHPPLARPIICPEDSFYCVIQGREVGVCFGEKTMKEWISDVDAPSIRKFRDWEGATRAFEYFRKNGEVQRIIGYRIGDVNHMFIKNASS